MGAGELYAMAGLNFGRSIGAGIAAIGQDYQERKKALDTEKGRIDAYARMGFLPDATPAPVGTAYIDSEGKAQKVKSVIAPDQYEIIQKHYDKASAENIGYLNAVDRMYSHVATQAMNPTYNVPVPGVGNVKLTGPQAATYSAARERAYRPASTKTTNPDLNFTHAVNAHNAQVGQIQDYFTGNYGFGPADALNDKAHIGYVFDKDSNQYVKAGKDQTPDAYSIQTGFTLGPRGKYVNDPANTRWAWATKDQLDTLRPQAEEWQKLQQNPPKREDYRRAQPQAGATGDLVAQANQIKAAYQSGKLSRDEAAAQIKALSIPGLQ